MRAISDEQLIQWVADGDSSCLGTLFERHHRAVFQYCRQLERDSQVSEDLVQEIFLRLLRKASSFRGRGSFKSWLFSIAHNVAFDYLRRQQRQAGKHQCDLSVDESLSDTPSTEQTAIDKQQLQQVAHSLESLPATVQEVIWLGRFVFNNYDELGQALGCSANSARVRMHRAMQLLNTALKQQYGASIYDG